MPGITSALDVMREMNPARIHSDADTPSRILVVGEPSQREVVAGWLGAGSPAGGSHPWLRQSGFGELRVPADPKRSAAVLTLAGITPDPIVREAARRLRDAGVPTIAVALHADAARLAGALPDVFGVPMVAVAPNATVAVFEAVVVPALLDQTPEVRGAELALARQFPVFRREYARRLVEDTARVNAFYAFSTGVAQLATVLNLPIAMADILVLSKNQINMAYKIALASGRDDRPRVLMGEVLGVIGAGLLFRQVARELVGLLPGFGLAPKVAVAYAGTRLVGTVVTAWAVDGRKVEIGELRFLYGEALSAGRRVAMELQSRAAGRTDPAAGRHQSLPPPAGPSERT